MAQKMNIIQYMYIIASLTQPTSTQNYLTNKPAISESTFPARATI